MIKILKSLIQDEKKFIYFLCLSSFILFLQDKFYFSDSLLYEDCAIDILDGKGFRDYQREPLYPLLMALVYALAGGKNIVLLRICESLIGAALCVVVFYLGKRIFNPIVTMLAAVISAFYPMFVFLPALSYPTLLCTFLVSIGVYLTVLGSYKNRKSLTIPGDYSGHLLL